MSRLMAVRFAGVVVCAVFAAACCGCDPRPAPKAALRVTIAPADAVEAGAEWQIEYGEWRAAGATATELAPGTYTIRFRDLAQWTAPPARTLSLQGGKTTVYAAAYEPYAGTGGLSQAELDDLHAQAAANGWTFTMGFNSATDRPLSAITGDIDGKFPAEARKDMAAEKEEPDIAALPAAFDWRAQGGVTPVKHARDCAASWAFATNAVMESIIKVVDRETVDLSEQYLISTNTEGWTCSTGGNRAFGFYVGHDSQCDKIGAILEQDFPYQSADAEPDCPYNPQFRLRSWGYVDGEFPSETRIKQAIMTYGPVYVSVTADRAFQVYTGGIYNNHTDGATNHAAVLVGWDDNQGTAGVWILRNAWGNGWGEDDGYMRIEYGCSNVGRWAAYAYYTRQRAPVLTGFTLAGGQVVTESRTVAINPFWKGSRPKSYLASELPNFSDASWKTFNNAITFTLSPGNVTKMVYLKLRNDIGESNVMKDSIILDEPAGEGEGEGEGENPNEADFAGIRFIWCPPGSFYMGNRTETDAETPKHRVTLSQGFWLSKYEITQSQYTAIASPNPSAFPGAGLPVDSVSWQDVNAYLDALNARYPGYNFRLPTEAEWEYACRAGSSTAYSFGDSSASLAGYAWFSDNGAAQTHAVGKKKPNPWGFFDMHGNVEEWVQDWYAAYSSATQTDPLGPLAATLRIKRGGSWQATAAECTSARRRTGDPAVRSNTAGFRIARD